MGGAAVSAAGAKSSGIYTTCAGVGSDWLYLANHVTSDPFISCEAIP